LVLMGGSRNATTKRRERKVCRNESWKIVDSFFVWEGLVLPDERKRAGVWIDHVIREMSKQRRIPNPSSVVCRILAAFRHFLRAVPRTATAA